jgi:hypothetical protein
MILHSCEDERILHRCQDFLHSIIHCLLEPSSFTPGIYKRLVKQLLAFYLSSIQEPTMSHIYLGDYGFQEVIT